MWLWYWLHEWLFTVRLENRLILSSAKLPRSYWPNSPNMSTIALLAKFRSQSPPRFFIAFPLCTEEKKWHYTHCRWPHHPLPRRQGSWQKIQLPTAEADTARLMSFFSDTREKKATVPLLAGLILNEWLIGRCPRHSMLLLDHKGNNLQFIQMQVQHLVFTLPGVECFQVTNLNRLTRCLIIFMLTYFRCSPSLNIASLTKHNRTLKASFKKAFNFSFVDTPSKLLQVRS